MESLKDTYHSFSHVIHHSINKFARKLWSEDKSSLPMYTENYLDSITYPCNLFHKRLAENTNACQKERLDPTPFQYFTYALDRWVAKCLKR